MDDLLLKQKKLPGKIHQKQQVQSNGQRLVPFPKIIELGRSSYKHSIKPCPIFSSFSVYIL